jgi:hypothetical protein
MNFLLKYILTDPADRSTLRENICVSVVKNHWTKFEYCAGEKISLSVHKQNSRLKWKEGCKFYYWSFEKRSNAIREIIYSVTPGNVCNESQKNIAWFQGSDADSMVRWCEIWQSVAASYICLIVHERQQQEDSVSCPKLIYEFPDCYCCNCLGERWKGRPRSHFRKLIASVCHMTPRCEHGLFLHECFLDFVFRFVCDG